MIATRKWQISARLPVILAVALFSCNHVFAQEQPDEEADISQHVDESEEAYRQRMELRDQPYGAQPRVQTTYTVPVSEGKLDQLPEASREHIKEQLRDLIIDNPQWQPGDDLTGYPYEPSAAAQTDPALQKLEREAWAEQLQKYQEREAAAYASANAGSNPNGSPQSGATSGGQQGQGGAAGAQGGSAAQSGDASATASSDSGSGQAGSPQGAEPGELASRTPKQLSTAGVSESALSFLQGKGGQVDEQTPPSPGESAGQAENAAAESTAGSTAESESDTDAAASENETSAEEIPGSMEISQLALVQGVDSATETAAAGDVSESKSAKQGSDTAGTREAQEKDETEDQLSEDLAGTLIIDDLKNFEAAMPPDGEVQTAPGVSGASAPDQPPEPGTLELPEPEQLDKN